ASERGWGSFLPERARDPGHRPAGFLDQVLGVVVVSKTRCLATQLDARNSSTGNPTRATAPRVTSRSGLTVVTAKPSEGKFPWPVAVSYPKSRVHDSDRHHARGASCGVLIRSGCGALRPRPPQPGGRNPSCAAIGQGSTSPRPRPLHRPASPLRANSGDF